MSNEPINGRIIASTLLWFARVSSVVTINMLIFFLWGDSLFVSLLDIREWIGFLFFPCGVVFGMLVAWRHEGFGGLITALSLAGFYFVYGLAVQGRFPQGWAYLLCSAPGLLFLFCHLLEMRLARTQPLPQGVIHPQVGGNTKPLSN